MKNYDQKKLAVTVAAAVPVALLLYKVFNNSISGKQGDDAKDNIKQSKSSNVSERDARRQRPVSFRISQSVASYVPIYGDMLRDRLYDNMKNSNLKLSRTDLVECGKYFDLKNADPDGSVSALPVPSDMQDRFVALWIQDKFVERIMWETAQKSRDLIHKWFTNLYWNLPSENAYHVTVFHHSQLEEYFPIETNTHIDSEGREDVYESEITGSQEIWREFNNFRIKAKDLVFTKTGNVLVLWESVHGNIDKLRKSFKGRFPNSPIGQTERIMHSTLARFVLPDNPDNVLPELTEEHKAGFAREFQAIADQIIGLEVEIDSLWYSGCVNFYDCVRFRYKIPKEGDVEQTI